MANPRENWGTGLGTAWGIFAATNPLKWAHPVIYFTSVAVGAIIATFFSPKQDKGKKSLSYDWRRTSNQTASHELPMPVVYGKARIKPVIKNRFVTTEGGKKYLNILYGFTGHKIDEVSVDVTDPLPNAFYPLNTVATLTSEPGKTYIVVKNSVPGATIAYVGLPTDPEDWKVWHGTAAITDIEINGNPANDYITGNSDDVRYETRPGLADQTLISGFDKTYSDIPQDVTLSDSIWTVVQSTSEVAQNIEITVYFPDGLFDLEDGRLIDEDAAVEIQYREIGKPSWLYLAERKVHAKYITIRSGHCLWQFKKAQPFYTSFTILNEGEYLETGKNYEIRIRKSNFFGTADTTTAIQLTNVATISYAADSDGDGDVDGLTYPGETLLGMKIRATEDLSGDIEVTGVVERSTVKVHDGTSWVDKNANLHAWACYDLLANGHPDHPAYPNTTNDSATIMSSYGAGVDKDRIDYTSFNDWASDIGTSLGYEVNIVFDTFTTVWDAVLKICQEGRGIVFPVGSQYKALPDVAKTPTYLFCMGNVNLGTFKRQWIDKAKKANSLELTFWDEEFDWRQTTFVLRTPDWDTSTELTDPLSLDLQGTTSYNQAFQTGIFYLNCNTYLNQIISMQSNIETLDVEVGDPVYVQHDTLTGDGGKVVSYDDDVAVLTLDKEVTMESGKTYELYVQHKGGAVDHITGITGNVTRSWIDWEGVSPDFSRDPDEYDNWAFGETGTAIKLFRIMDISANSQYTREILALEYNALVYQDSNGDDLSVSNADRIAGILDKIDWRMWNNAENLEARELISYNRLTGEYESSIHLIWKILEGNPSGEWEVSFRDVDAVDPNWQGEWDNAINYRNLFEKVEHNGFTYVNLTENNTGIEPFNR